MGYLGFDGLAREGTFHEHHPAVDPRHGRAPVSELLTDGQLH
jgi:hypothetical protein